MSGKFDGRNIRGVGRRGLVWLTTGVAIFEFLDVRLMVELVGLDEFKL